MDWLRTPRMRRRALRVATGLLALFVGSPAAGAAPNPVEEHKTALQVEGLSASIGEDNPRVLYILPWQAPTLPRRPRASLQAEFPELKRPADPSALERHREFRDTLDPLILAPVDGTIKSTR